MKRFFMAATAMATMMAIFLPVSAARAQDAGENANKLPPSIQRQHERRAAEMMPYDLDRDGILRMQELLAVPGPRFDAMDLNGDGVLSGDEIEAAVARFRAEQAAVYGALIERRARDLGNLYRKADADGNGYVSRDEFIGYFTTRYGSFDRDGDGIVTTREYRMDVEDLPRSYIERKRD